MPRFTQSPLLLPLALGALACAADPEQLEEANDLGTTHSVVTIERASMATSESEASASAVARFVNVPAFTNPKLVLGAAGLSLDLPAPDTCRSSDGQAEQLEVEAPPSLQGPIELVEVGDVSIVSSGVPTLLVPHAFPTVGNFASGVLYATRDRTSATLPAEARYVLSATGSASTPALSFAAEAPASPGGVEVAGTPLGDVAEVRASQGLELSWVPGETTDAIYVELLAYDGSPSLLCTFRDDAGAGLIPEGAFSGTGSGRIALHRLRTSALGESEVRFDFQLGATVEFAR